MTKLTDEEYLNKVCKENRFTLKFKQVKTGSSKKKYTNCIVNMEDLIKWRLKYGISQQDMVTIGMIGMNLRKIQQLEENEKIYNLSLTSNKEKLIISKDSKGDPSIFEIKINVNYVVKKDEEILISNKINKKTTYNNITDKFELENYEKNIINNLVSEISENIKLSISIVSER